MKSNDAIYNDDLYEYMAGIAGKIRCKKGCYAWLLLIHAFKSSDDILSD